MDNFKQALTFIKSCGPAICPAINFDYLVEELDSLYKVCQRIENNFNSFKTDKEAYILKVSKFIKEYDFEDDEDEE